MITRFNRILFDYDGTLIIHHKVDEGGEIAKILNLPDEQIKEFGNRLKTLFGTAYGREYYANKKMTRDLFLHILDKIMFPEEFGVTAAKIEDAINEKAKYKAELAPNAKETLEYLSNRGYELCIFTNGFYKSQAENMKYHGIHDYFERIYAWDDFYAKPDMRALKRALAGTDPRYNVMIGDDAISDIKPAKQYGLYTVGINLKNAKKANVEPDVLIDDLAKLKEIL